MISHLIQYLKGYIRIQIEGNSIERFINICRIQNIQLWKLSSRNHCYEMNLYLHDFYKLRNIRQTTNVHISIIQKHGIVFFIQKYTHKKAFILGIMICMCMLYLFCNRIWSIQISGNQFYSDENLQKFLHKNSICIGMKRNDVQCEEIVHLLRTRFNEIVWVSASIDGTKLTLKIKENSQSVLQNVSSNLVDQNAMDITSDKSGIIIKLITREGIPLCHEGDAVIPGQIMISGSIPIKNDSDEIVSYKKVISDADIYATTKYNYQDNLCNTYQRKIYNNKKHRQFYIRHLNTILITNPILLRKYQEMYVVNSRLNFLNIFTNSTSWGMKEIRTYHYEETKHNKKEIQKILSSNFQLFCNNLVKKGVQITSNSVKIFIGDSNSKAEGYVFTVEKIGFSKPSQIPEIQNERIQVE